VKSFFYTDVPCSGGVFVKGTRAARDIFVPRLVY